MMAKRENYMEDIRIEDVDNCEDFRIVSFENCKDLRIKDVELLIIE